MHARAGSIGLLVVLLALALPGAPAFAQLPPLPPPPILPPPEPPPPDPAALLKLDVLLQERVAFPSERSRVIVRSIDSASLGGVIELVQNLGGELGRLLPIIDGQAADVPNISLPLLADNPLVARVSLDRLILGGMDRTGATVGAITARQEFSVDGSGIGVAIIDSGVTPWHDDLADDVGVSRVHQFVDFVGEYVSPYDDYGHGTHVAGIIAGNGFDSGGARSGIAPGAHLVVLKTLDAFGRGRISDTIAALEHILVYKDTFNIRVLNMSIAAGVYESYDSDPLTLAVKRVVEAGVVVVAAAGNLGRTSDGDPIYGGVTAPGNAPWVLTVGASSHMGTADRADDTIAPFSSRGPTLLDRLAKPDLLAPGVGIVSLSDPNSAFYTSHSQYLLNGTVTTSYLPYLSLSGTSMAAPVVAGTAALMLQANPALTPTAVKGILQYTAQEYAGLDTLTQGAGFLDAHGALTLAQFFGNPVGTYPSSPTWSTQLIWGNHSVQGGQIWPDANAWLDAMFWGQPTSPDGGPLEWGVACETETCQIENTWHGWRPGPNSQNVVWGSECGGEDCQSAWSPSEETVATDDGDGVVWGTNDEGDGVVWGTGDDGDGVVWGTDDPGDGVVWGTTCADPSCQTTWEQQ